MSDRYWVSPLYSTFDSNQNWSLISGGAGGASVPDSSQIAIFNGSGQGSCQFNVPVSVSGIKVLSDYSGTLQLHGNPFSIGLEDGTFNGGFFSGNSSLIDITGNLVITDTNFTSTSSLMTLYGNLSYTPSTIPISPQGDELFVEYHTIGANEAVAKQFSLATKPEDTSSVMINVIHGIAQELGFDYYVEDRQVKWDQQIGPGHDASDLPMASILETGDVLRIVYNPADGYKSFFHAYGTMKFAADNEINGRGARFWNLSIDSDNTGPRIDSSCFVDGALILDRGIIRQGSDGTVHVWGDVTCNLSGGAWSPYHNAVIQMEGLRTQRIITNGGILPTLVVDKTTSNKVILDGSPPLYINGDLLVMDGTMSTAGIDLRVGGNL